LATPGSDQQIRQEDEARSPPEVRAPRRGQGLPPRPERDYWQLLPRRNFRRALFLVLALLGVLIIKRAGGLSLSRLFDGVAPPPPPASSSAGGKARAPERDFQHLDVRR
jgi:hypothetical protein